MRPNPIIPVTLLIPDESIPRNNRIALVNAMSRPGMNRRRNMVVLFLVIGISYWLTCNIFFYVECCDVLSSWIFLCDTVSFV